MVQGRRFFFMSEGEKCWHCKERQRVSGQILCERCLDEAAELLAPLVSQQVAGFAAAQKAAEADAAKGWALVKAFVEDGDGKDSYLMREAETALKAHEERQAGIMT